jgi:hypothetical protein
MRNGYNGKILHVNFSFVTGYRQRTNDNGQMTDDIHGR